MHSSRNRDHALTLIVLAAVFGVLIAAHLAGLGAQMPAPASSDQAMRSFVQWRMS